MTRDWSDDWIVHELGRVLRDLPAVDPRLARRLLRELPLDQRIMMADALAHLNDEEHFTQPGAPPL